MPTLRDQILDEAQELAVNKVLLPDATDDTILDALSDIVDQDLHNNHPFDQLALRCYRYWCNLSDQVESAFTGWYEPPAYIGETDGA
jgi:hypothetical protein